MHEVTTHHETLNNLLSIMLLHRLGSRNPDLNDARVSIFFILFYKN